MITRFAAGGPGIRARGLLHAAAGAACVALVLLGCGETKPPLPPPPEVVVADVVQKDVTLDSEWVGTTDGDVNAQIRPKVQGYLLTQDYPNGGLVKAGQLLFQIDPRQFKAAYDEAVGQLGRAQAQLGKSTLDVARYTPLAKEGAVSQQELDDAVQQKLADTAAVAQASAAVEQARLNLEWTKVTSPIDGIAGINVAQIGDLVSPQTVLTTVSTVNPIKVDFPISEQQYLEFARRINERSAGETERPASQLTLILANGETYPYPGTVSAANRQVDVRTGTILIQGLFPNPDNILRPGQFAKVRAAVKVVKNALLVPQRAVSELQGSHEVAVVGPNDVVQIRPVKTGEKSNGSWIVENGLKPGERVVVEGLQKVRDGLKVVVEPAPTTPPGSASAKPATAAPAATASPAHAGGK